jgi:hypothetical protein
MSNLEFEADAKRALRHSSDLNDYERREATQERQRDRSWHIDRGVPLALVLSMLVQAGGIIWWANGITKDSAEYARRLTTIEGQRTSERLTVLESQRIDSAASLQRIEAKVDRLIETRTR